MTDATSDGMREYRLKPVTAEVANLTVRLAMELPEGWVVRELGRQLLRAGCGVGANYRAASRAQSTRDLISKLKKVEEEADETGFWIDQLLIIGLSASITARAKRIANLSEEVTALTVAAIKTCRARVSYSRHKLPS